jgi:Ni/Co efflux regulator RcnB
MRHAHVQKKRGKGSGAASRQFLSPEGTRIRSTSLHWGNTSDRMEFIMKRHLFLAVLATSLTAFAGAALAQGDGDLAAQKEATRQLKRDQRWREGEQVFRRGDRLPLEYRNRTYQVDDWRGHRLSAPPRGYHWVQIGGDYALVANNTGRVRQFYPHR